MDEPEPIASKRYEECGNELVDTDGYVYHCKKLKHRPRAIDLETWHEDYVFFNGKLGNRMRGRVQWSGFSEVDPA